MTIWAWMLPVDRIWKVVTDSEKGSVEVYNERSDLIVEQKNLKKEAVLLIEDNFLGIVAIRLTNKDQKLGDNADNKKVSDYNPMYA